MNQASQPRVMAFELSRVLTPEELMKVAGGGATGTSICGYGGFCNCDDDFNHPRACAN